MSADVEDGDRLVEELIDTLDDDDQDVEVLAVDWNTGPYLHRP